MTLLSPVAHRTPRFLGSGGKLVIRTALGMEPEAVFQDRNTSLFRHGQD